MPANIEVDGTTVLVRVETERIEAETGQELRARTVAALPREGARVAIDLSRVKFLDSSGLGVLVSLLKEVRPTGDVVLCGAQPGVAQVLRMTHLDAVFHCARDRAEAVEHLTRASAPA